MTISMYQASMPVFIRMLRNLKGLLEKGAAHADAKKFEASALVNALLAPDMFALARQVQIAADMAKGCAAGRAGADVPKDDHSEATIPEVMPRIGKTVARLKT